jgi:hypothetical protein
MNEVREKEERHGNRDLDMVFIFAKIATFIISARTSD